MLFFQGLPVYANFGSREDFEYLLEAGISLRGCIVLLRLGRISIFEKVIDSRVLKPQISIHNLYK